MVTRDTDNDTVITIQKLPKSDWNCDTITRYRVYYKLTKQKDGDWALLESQNRTVVVKGLPTRQSFHFMIGVVNSGRFQTNGSVEYKSIPRAPIRYYDMHFAVWVAVPAGFVVIAVISVTIYLCIRKRNEKTPTQAESVGPAGTETTNVSLSSIPPENGVDQTATRTVTRSTLGTMPPTRMSFSYGFLTRHHSP
ncbi:uncharacterized protein LOC135487070 [Lineus longissimus]|uniref:uncharacterized protein LOC135487070 n=1 Tax=Lineus longissimus TaxID=88925 RepID=UPI00315C85F7